MSVFLLSLFSVFYCTAWIRFCKMQILNRSNQKRTPVIQFFPFVFSLSLAFLLKTLYYKIL